MLTPATRARVSARCASPFVLACVLVCVLGCLLVCAPGCAPHERSAVSSEPNGAAPSSAVLHPDARNGALARATHEPKWCVPPVGGIEATLDLLRRRDLTWVQVTWTADAPAPTLWLRRAGEEGDGFGLPLHRAVSAVGDVRSCALFDLRAALDALPLALEDHDAHVATRALQDFLAALEARDAAAAAARLAPHSVAAATVPNHQRAHERWPHLLRDIDPDDPTPPTAAADDADGQASDMAGQASDMAGQADGADETEPASGQTAGGETARDEPASGEPAPDVHSTHNNHLPPTPQIPWPPELVAALGWHADPTRALPPIKVRGDTATVTVWFTRPSHPAFAIKVPVVLRRSHATWGVDARAFDLAFRDARRVFGHLYAYPSGPRDARSSAPLPLNDTALGGIEPGSNIFAPVWAVQGVIGPYARQTRYQHYRFRASQPGTLRLELRGIDGFDVMLAVAPIRHDDLSALPEGWVMDDRDLDAGDLDAEISVRLNARETVYIYATHALRGELGRYELTATWHPGDLSGAPWVEVESRSPRRR